MVKNFFFFFFPPIFFFFFPVGKVVRYNTALARFRDNPGRGILEKLLAVFWRAFWRGMVRVQYFICDFLSSVAIAKYNKIYNKRNNNKL